MIQAWRIVKAKHKTSAFTGEGCQFASGRWHHLRVLMVYCSDSQALAVLETFVHIQDEAKHLSYVSFELNIPAALILDVESIERLPKQWRKQPAIVSTKNIGSEWISSSASAVLSAPSAIVPSGRNYLLNPQHANFNKITIKKPVQFSFDPRLWK